MRHVVQHTELVEGSVEARAYQLEAVDEALAGSMLLVLPTAAGKTAVSWMLIAEILPVSYTHLTLPTNREV